MGGLDRNTRFMLMVHRLTKPEHSEKILIPVHSNGYVHQLVRLPDDVDRLEWLPPANERISSDVLAIRRVRWLERTFHMTIRVLMCYLHIPTKLKSKFGLTLRQALFDLPGAYQAAMRLVAYYPSSEYVDWLQRIDTLSEEDIRVVHSHISRLPARPHFHLLVVVGNNRDALQVTLASLSGQLYGNFTCFVLDGTDTAGVPAIPDVDLKNTGMGSRVVAQSAMDGWLAEFNTALAGEWSGEWAMLLHAGDSLPSHALYWFACAVLEHRDAVIVYSDDDIMNAAGIRSDPRFKPDWSPEHLRSTHYIGAAAILRSDAVAAVGGVRLDSIRHGNYELLLRVSDAFGVAPIHVPAALFHRNGETCTDDAWEHSQWSTSVLRAHLKRTGVPADVEPTLPGCRHVRYRLPTVPPLVSIIVPTRDAVTLLRQCIESVFTRTTYTRFELLVVDNQSADPETLVYLEEIADHPAIRVLRFDQAFNYSAINNFAAREAKGEVLCLLNNDTSIISSGWLEEMVGHLLQDHVGVVGAKLYYPDSRVQHAGVAVGPGGCADHVSLGIGHSDPGYCYRAVVAHELSAVTGACMVTWKHLYERLGGLNEDLAVGFNDVDYCLRVQEAGYRVIFTPHAELFHHESATRGRDDHKRHWQRNSREVRYMRTRWSKRMIHDPYYNPNFSYRRPDFSLAETPRVKKPWLAGKA